MPVSVTARDRETPENKNSDGKKLAAPMLTTATETMIATTSGMRGLFIDEL
jgi:hypothetical protein